MTGEGHVIFAIASAIFAKRAELTPVLAQADWWHLISSALLTCLLPDIDHPEVGVRPHCARLWPSGLYP